MVNSRNDTITSAARFPKIGLPTFSGDYLEWTPFRDIFLPLVHNNAALTEVQKYFYLKGSCTGTPQEMVDEYPAADASYALAWSALSLLKEMMRRKWLYPLVVNIKVKYRTNNDDCFMQIQHLQILLQQTPSAPVSEASSVVQMLQVCGARGS
ncbi:uncharacterized protein LOC118745410 [Rhagoletis pomonella]|uniref:uncharacterized protein LOC118745410 n=1 Tax=Rhagoletis pomonella TaxID=28610 RepID=UPI001782A3E3|nr:uncharacterized protein LOC118745410 [Rhagoletis pomonella]